MFVKPVSEALDVSRSKFTMYSTLSMIASMLSLPVVSNVFKKINYKTITVTAAVIIGGILFAYSFSNEMWHFYVLSTLSGVANSFLGAVPIVILINNWFEEKRGFATSVAFAGGGLASIFLAPLITEAILAAGWRKAYQLTGIAFWLMTLPALLLFTKVRPEDMGLKALGTSGATEKHVAISPDVKASGFTRKEAVRTKSFWIFSAGIFLSSLVAFGVMQHMVSYLGDIGYSSVEATKWFSIYNAIAVVAKAGTGALYDHCGIKKSSVLLTAIVCASLFCGLYASERRMLVLFVLLFGISSGIQIVPPTYMTNMYFGDLDYSANYGLVTTIYFCGMAVGIQCSSMIFDSFGSYGPAFVLYIILTVIMLALWLISKKTAIAERKEKLGEIVNF